VERAVQRYSGGMGWLGQRLPLPGPPQLLLLTQRRVAGPHAHAQPLGGEGDAAGPAPGQPLGSPGSALETVAHAAPLWGRPIPAPASWDATFAQVGLFLQMPILCASPKWSIFAPGQPLVALQRVMRYACRSTVAKNVRVLRLQGAGAAAASAPAQEDVLQVHLTTPLGPGTAQLSQRIVHQFLKVRLPLCMLPLLLAHAAPCSLF
jgi:hypothetical protein